MATGPMAITLTVVKGPQTGRMIEVAEPRGFIIGRGADADLCLPQDDPYVSRRHVFLEICPPACRLQNLSVTNPLHVNGQEAEECELHDGDVIEVGYTQLRVTIRFPEAGGRHRCPQCGTEIELLAGEQPPQRCVACAEAEARCLQRSEIQAVPLIQCDRCSGDLTMRANSDGEAFKYREIATYRCAACYEEILPKGEDGGSAIGAYEVRGPLGAGGMGVVSFAYDRSTARLFVLKRIKDVKNPMLAKRFEREVRLMRGLTHRNIVRCVDTGLDETGIPFVVMEFVPDGSLQDRMTAAKCPLQPVEAVPLIGQVLDGLAYIHGQSIIHRDVKPQNILIRRHRDPAQPGGYTAKLADFGLAVSYARAGGTRLTKAGSGLGTLMFMPPEQITDAATVREPADTYAVGVTLYYLLTGQYPYNFPCIPHPYLIILGDAPIPIRQRNPAIPESLAAVVDRAVRKEVTARFQAAEEFRQAIQGVKWR